MSYPAFDRSRLRIQPLASRQHDLDLSALLPLDAPLPALKNAALPELGRRLVAARGRQSARILMMGAHVLRAGVSRYLVDLMERGLVDHIAMNGAGPIHDWELALIGATTESVARYIQTGEFGLWQETGRMNDAILEGAKAGIGLGGAALFWTAAFLIRILACSRRASAWGCRLPCTSASATTSCTSIPIAMALHSDRAAIRIF
jgi:hypothetical protein